MPKPVIWEWGRFSGLVASGEVEDISMDTEGWCIGSIGWETPTKKLMKESYSFVNKSVNKSPISNAKKCEVRDLNPRSRAWEARTLTRLGQPRL
jgi:hypothetical protein